MKNQKWLPAKDVAERYGVGDKWPWHQQRKDPRFPRGIRFSTGMTRWSSEQLDNYDRELVKQ